MDCGADAELRLRGQSSVLPGWNPAQAASLIPNAPTYSWLLLFATSRVHQRWATQALGLHGQDPCPNFLCCAQSVGPGHGCHPSVSAPPTNRNAADAEGRQSTVCCVICPLHRGGSSGIQLQHLMVHLKKAG